MTFVNSFCNQFDLLNRNFDHLIKKSLTRVQDKTISDLWMRRKDFFKIYVHTRAVLQIRSRQYQKHPDPTAVYWIKYKNLKAIKTEVQRCPWHLWVIAEHSLGAQTSYVTEDLKDSVTRFSTICLAYMIQPGPHVNWQKRVWTIFKICEVPSKFSKSVRIVVDYADSISA